MRKRYGGRPFVHPACPRKHCAIYFQAEIDLEADKAGEYMEKLRVVARSVWKVARWSAGTIVIAFLVSYAANLAVVQGDPKSTTFVIFLQWLWFPSLHRTLIFSVLTVAIILSLLSGVLVTTEPSLPTFSENRERRYRLQVLAKVRAYWITKFLKESLHGATVIPLTMQEQPDALLDPWQQGAPFSDRTASALPSDAHIGRVYDEAGGELLILGEPGSGKTTLLLELTKELLHRAEKDETHPIPIVFRLSAWEEGEDKLLEKWLVNELAGKYQISKRLGQTWVENDYILPLLDGLDEVKSDHMLTVCIEAINRYRKDHGGTPIVVSCRRANYVDQPERLLLQKAVIVEPLALPQIDEYLASTGEQLDALRLSIYNDSAMQELLANPFMLSIVTLVYQETPREQRKPLQALTTREQVFETYTSYMLEHRNRYMRYPLWQVTYWLSVLARNGLIYESGIYFPDVDCTSWWRKTYNVIATILFSLLDTILLGLSTVCIFAGLPLLLNITIASYLGSIKNLSLLQGIQIGLLMIVYLGVLMGVFTALTSLQGWTEGPSGRSRGLGWALASVLEIFEALLTSKRVKNVWQHNIPDGIWLIYGLFYGLVCGFVTKWFTQRWEIVLLSGSAFGIAVVILIIFDTTIDNLLWKLSLWRKGYIPWNYRRFLDDAVKRILLRKAGEDYFFIHQLLREYFAGAHRSSTPDKHSKGENA